MDYRNLPIKFTQRNTIFCNTFIHIIIGVSIIISLCTACEGNDVDSPEKSTDLSEGSVVFQDGEFEIVSGGPIVIDPEINDAIILAVDRYTASPDVETCSELIEWYVNGLEIAFNGQLLKLIEDHFNIDTALLVVGRVDSILTEKMVETLKQNDSLCSRSENFSTNELVLPDLKPVTQRIVSLLEQHGGYISLEGSTALKAAVTIAEGREIIFEIERFSDDNR